MSIGVSNIMQTLDNNFTLCIKKLKDTAVIPTRGTVDSAGLDLYALEDYLITPQSNVSIHTGIAMSIPSGYVGLLFARSGLATKRLLRPANCVGVIDSDYRGEIIVSLYNDGDEIQHINSGDRIAQMVITPYLTPKIIEVDSLDSTNRGEQGFGSTGQ